MVTLRAFWAARGKWFNSEGREQRIIDYVDLANRLIWQRQASFLAASVLAAVYFNPISAFVCFMAVLMTELLDFRLGRQAKDWDGQDPVVGRKILQRMTLNTLVSSIAIGLFIINIASQQTSGGHFTPLFFLFSASIFAAMYNSQLIGILLLRLSIYSLVFLYIALMDILRYAPPLSSKIWLEFFTTIFVLYFIFDISGNFYKIYQERLLQVKRIKEENRRTKAAYDVKSQFLSTVSHELRTPLTSIKASLDLANNGALGQVPDNLKSVLGIAGRNAQRLANLIDDLLDLQQIEAGEMAFQFKPINAKDLVEEAVESTEAYAEKFDVRLATDSLPENCWIMGDYTRLSQVMSNLLSNAVKFSDKGGYVQVRAEVLDGRVRISVQDDGSGIPENAKNRVFGKFTQVDSSDNRKVGGTGLGLNISKQIVDRHEATIDYISELGVGSTFFVEFDRLEDNHEEGTDLDPIARVA